MITILPLGDDAMVCKLEFVIPGEVGVFPLEFYFSFENGVVKFTETQEEDETETETFKTNEVLNKYMKRRLS